jgi:hypothetical protein
MTNVFVIKRIFIIMLSFLVLSSTFANLCWATPSSSFGAGHVPDFRDQDQGHSHHQQSPQHSKIPCSKVQFCCSFIVQNSLPYAFVLSSTLMSPFEITFQPLEIPKFLYRPPEIPL